MSISPSPLGEGEVGKTVAYNEDDVGGELRIEIGKLFGITKARMLLKYFSEKE